MSSMNTSKLVKVRPTVSPSLVPLGMIKRLPLRRFSLRKTVYPESLCILIYFLHNVKISADANDLLCSVAVEFAIAIVSVDTTKSCRRVVDALSPRIALAQHRGGPSASTPT
jgi:hypothetical protein